MKLIIKEVGISTYNPDTDKISDFWIRVQLKSGYEIEIKDNLPFDLRKLKGQEIDGLIYLMLSKIPVDDSTSDKPDKPILHGEYLGEYKIPKKWIIPKFFQLKYRRIQIYHAIKIEDVQFIINPNIMKYYTVLPGEVFTFKSVGLELWAWEPIK